MYDETANLTSINSMTYRGKRIIPIFAGFAMIACTGDFMSSDSHSEELFFAEEEHEEESRSPQKPWVVLVVDDDQFVHQVTTLVLKDFTFQGRGLDFISAYSGQEARRILSERDDVALVLLDVVMEKNDAGLEVVRWLRNEQKNTFIRIILRTGQPGHAPENQVITEYDINDYKEKTELTTQKLFSAVTTALRSYADLQAIDRNRRGLEMVIGSTADLFRHKSLSHFASGVLTQLVSVLGQNNDGLMLRTSGLAAARGKEGALKVIASTGRFSGMEGDEVERVQCPDALAVIQEALDREEAIFRENTYVGYFRTSRGSESIIYLCGDRSFDEMDRDLIRLFASNIGVAFDNLDLNNEITETQRELLFTLGEVVETRSRETANHVRRVAEYSALLGQLADMDIESVELLRQASPMHDLGKIGIPDAILLKPGKLTREEFEVIKTHTSIGHQILSGSERPLTQEAALVSLNHHEKWDGSGYPQGLAGRDIPLSGRIAAVADVFDALACKRVYKDAWPTEKILDYFRSQRGVHFDPELVDLLFDNLDDFLEIKRQYPE